MKHYFLYISFILVFLFGSGCDTKTVNITLQRQGEVTILSTNALDKSFENSTKILEHRENYIDFDNDNFLRVDVRSTHELRHNEGDENISSLELEGTIYRCESHKNSESAAAKYRLTPSSPEDEFFYYSYLFYIPFIKSKDIGEILTSPPQDLCFSISADKPNKDPYKNGYTKYRSNYLKIGADELQIMVID